MAMPKPIKIEKSNNQLRLGLKARAAEAKPTKGMAKASAKRGPSLVTTKEPNTAPSASISTGRVVKLPSKAAERLKLALISAAKGGVTRIVNLR